MLVNKPDYYESFHCIAGECQHNCCLGGWEIEIDVETVKKYEKVEGAFGEKLRNSIQKPEEYCFRLENGQCPFLKEDHLCEIYERLGPGNMGRVCNEFPRFLEYFGDYKEMGLGLACEEVGRILLSKVSRTEFLKETIPKDTLYDTEKVEKTVCRSVFYARDYVISLLQDRKENLLFQFVKVMDFSEKYQERINENQWQLSVDEIALTENDAMFTVETEQSLETISRKEQMRFLEDMLYDFEQLYPLEDTFIPMLKSLDTFIHDQDIWTLWQQFVRDCGVLEIQYEQLLVYFAYRYYSQTIYDCDWNNKTKFIAVCFMMLFLLYLECWYKNNGITLEQQIEITRIFSRQVEYSEQNLEQLQDNFLFGNTYDMRMLKSVVFSWGKEDL